MPTYTQADNLHQDSGKAKPIRDIAASAYKQPLQHGGKRQQIGTNQKESIKTADYNGRPTQNKRTKIKGMELKAQPI
jgi:hypothetical protein